MIFITGICQHSYGRCINFRGIIFTAFRASMVQNENLCQPQCI